MYISLQKIYLEVQALIAGKKQSRQAQLPAFLPALFCAHCYHLHFQEYFCSML
jgi:hypothetical protein